MNYIMIRDYVLKYAALIEEETLQTVLGTLTRNSIRRNYLHFFKLIRYHRNPFLALTLIQCYHRGRSAHP